MLNAIEIMELQKLAGMEKFSKRTVAEELERRKLIELIHYCTSCEECRDADIADHLIANGVAVQQWIPITERLPDEDIRVLVHLDPNSKWNTDVVLDTDRRHENRWVRWGDAITHWMPLPQPPKGE